MWWAGSESVHIFLGRTRVGMQVFGGGPAQWEVGRSASDLWMAALEEIRARRRVSVRIWLSGSVARPFILPAVQGLGTLADARMVAATRAPEETGLVGPCCVSMDVWRPGEPAMCVAMEEGLRKAIEAGEDAKKVRVVGIRPWWAAVLCDPACEANSLSILTVDDGESLVALAGLDQQIEVASTYVPVLDDLQRAALMQRVISATGRSNARRRHASFAAAPEATPASGNASQCPFTATWQDA